MATSRTLIVNADDFGLSDGVNRGIIEAHERGIVTSASLMVRQPAAPAAAAYGREHPALSLGLHIELGEWTYRDGAWEPRYQVVPEDDPDAVAAELSRQLDAFRRLVGRDPTHLDSHQHAHRHDPLRSLAGELARTLGVPLRHFSPTVQYCGAFYGQTAEGIADPDAIRVDRLSAILSSLPGGCTELACHPGRDDQLASAYRLERSSEVDALCDPRIHALVRSEDIVLRSFHDLSRLAPAVPE